MNLKEIENRVSALENQSHLRKTGLALVRRIMVHGPLSDEDPDEVKRFAAIDYPQRGVESIAASTCKRYLGEAQ